MTGIVLPSIGFMMTERASHPLKIGSGIFSGDPSDEKKSQLWLCIGDHDDIDHPDSVIFQTSPLRVGNDAEDDQTNRLAVISPATSHPHLRQTPVKRERP